MTTALGSSRLSLSSRASIPPNPYPDVMVEVAYVTPHQAKAWLATNTLNRKLRKSHVSWLGRMFSKGQLHLSNDAICFDINNVLLNGQHRLTACVETGIGFWAIIAVGMPRECRFAMDLVFVRSLMDMLMFAGIENASNPLGSLINAMHHPQAGGSAHKKLNPQEAVDFATTHADAIRLVMELFGNNKSKGLCRASARAAVGRAFYHVDHSRLREFVYCLTKNQLFEPGNEAATVLSKYLLTTSEDAFTIYGKCERAIHAFARQERIVKLYAPEVILFALPEEKDSGAA